MSYRKDIQKVIRRVIEKVNNHSDSRFRQTFPQSMKSLLF